MNLKLIKLVEDLESELEALKAGFISVDIPLGTIQVIKYYLTNDISSVIE